MSVGDAVVVAVGDAAVVAAGAAAVVSAGDTEAVLVDVGVPVADGEQLGEGESVPLADGDDCAARTWDWLPYAVARLRQAVPARRVTPATAMPTTHPVKVLLNANSHLYSKAPLTSACWSAV